MSTDILKYCICVIDKKNGEITYYPKFQIKEYKIPLAPTSRFNITIANGTDTTILMCSENNYLLNKSPYEMFELDVLPTVTTTIFNPLNDISKFVKNINEGFTPFCVPMQFWMNPNSVLTKDYLPKELILMKGLTEEPEPNQKGELMCKMLLDNSFEGCKLKGEDNFNSIDTDATKLTKGVEPVDPVVPVKAIGSSATAAKAIGPVATVTVATTATTNPIMVAVKAPAKPKRSEKTVAVAVSSGKESAKSVEETAKPVEVAVSSGKETKPAESVEVAVSSGEEPEKKAAVTPPEKPKRIIKGAGLKSCKATDTFEGCLKRNFATQPVMPRIYRPIQQRKTDYYNYA